MIDARMKEALKRTKKHLVRHLEDINDEIDQDNGRIKNHMLLDGIKDDVKTLACLEKLMKSEGDEGEESPEEGEETTVSRSASVLK